MEALIDWNRSVHIVAGAIGLVAWWVPTLSKKGARLHKRFGKLFAAAAYAIGFTALASLAMRVSWSAAQGTLAGNEADLGFLVFLGYIGVIVIDLTYYAIRVIRTRRDHGSLATPLLSFMNVAMAAGSVLVFLFAVVFWSPVSIILLLLSPIGVKQAYDQIQYTKTIPTLKKAWFYQHMDAMLGSGAAFHTAFLVFGSRQFLDYSMLGAFNWLPWIIPAALAVVGGEYWKRQYMRRFGDLGQVSGPGQAASA